MAEFKEFTSADRKTSTSFLYQLVDVVQEDVSGSSTRRTHLSFITASAGSVTSSLYQTVYDQDFTLQTSNAILDLTVGLFSGSHSVTGSSTGVDSAGKVLFPSHSLMMREKVEMYRQFAQTLLGSAGSHFQSPFATDAVTVGDTAAIDEALFVTFKRLFAREHCVLPQG